MVSYRLLLEALVFVIFDLYCIKKSVLLVWVAGKSAIMFVFLIFSF